MKRTNKHRVGVLALLMAMLTLAGGAAWAADDLQMMDLQYNEHSNSIRLVVTANMPFMYEVREAGAGTLIIETDHADISKLASSYNIGSSVVDLITITNHGAPTSEKTEIIVKYNGQFSYSHSLQGRKLIVAFSRNKASEDAKPVPVNDTRAKKAVPAPEKKAESSKNTTNSKDAEEPKPKPVVRRTASTNKKADKASSADVNRSGGGKAVAAKLRLIDISQQKGEGWTNVILKLNGNVDRGNFRILPVSAPKRFVMDFHQTMNSIPSTALRNDGEFFTQVRSALNRIDPYPVTRVVFDQGKARKKADPEVEIAGNTVVLKFGSMNEEAAPADTSPVKIEKVADTKQPSKEKAKTNGESKAARTKKSPETKAVDEKPVEEVKPVVIESSLPETNTGQKEEKPVEQAELKSEKAEEITPQPVKEKKQVESKPVESQSNENPFDLEQNSAKETPRPVDQSMKEETTPPVMESRKPAQREIKGNNSGRDEIPVSKDTLETDESVFDRAFPQDTSESMQDRLSQQESSDAPPEQQDDSVTELVAGDPDFFQARELSTAEQGYTGKVVDLEFDSVPLSSVILLLGQLTEKNFIVDPSVSNINISISMRNEPWDKALDYILDYHGLGKVVDGNLIRIATRDKLTSEAAEKRRLREEQALAVPLRQVAKPVNYATANELAKLVRENLSTKGTVVVDDRTNTLIITDIPDKVDEHLNLVETLDIPTKQVYVEARIVETTRDFINELGLQFGFRSSYNQNYGKSTGLVFPNQFTISGSPLLGTAPAVDNNLGGTPWMINLPSPEASTSLLGSFSNISGSFVLDALLSAAESERKVRVLSRPRVSAQNNKQAEIKSGVEVPYQVIQNNTVSIRYREATLKLTVTPHITADDTVIMDLVVDKSSLGVRTDAGFAIQTRKATSTIRVKDGGVAVIGGVLEINDSYTEERMPILHRIPLLGNLFKNRLTRIQNTELIIFISPKIIG